MCTHIAQTVNAKKSPERIILFVNILSLISIQFDVGWCLAKMWWMAWYFFARVHYQWRPYFSLLCCWCCWFRSLFNEVGCKKSFQRLFCSDIFLSALSSLSVEKIHICLFFNWLNKFSNKKTNANLVKTRSWCFFPSSDYLIESVFFGGFSRLLWDWNTGMTKTKRKLSLDEIAVKYSYTR